MVQTTFSSGHESAMRILIMAEYFPPEEVGAAIWIHQLAADLAGRGHAVTVLTAFPNYPLGRVFPGYRRRLFERSFVDSIQVIRTYIYATRRRSFLPRAASFGSFCLSALLAGWTIDDRFDLIYAILPPLPLGVSGVWAARAKGAALVLHLQDIYPDIAVATGYLTSRPAIQFFQAMEKWIYRNAGRILVISEGFRDNLLAKGVPPERITVIPNWADPDQIQPAAKQNAFRREWGDGAPFIVIYAGGLGHNSALEPVLSAAEILKFERFRFLIAGDGPRKQALVEAAGRKHLENVTFCGFQPLERYGELLAAADATLVTLNREATFASVPSKVYKQMAAARPILAITEGHNELERLVERARCGFCVSPSQPERLAQILRYAAGHPADMEEMGNRGRQYLEQHHSRHRALDQIEEALVCTVRSGSRG
jgi:colanic acid biosynthesis glycosyl transferase WcaI